MDPQFDYFYLWFLRVVYIRNTHFEIFKLEPTKCTFGKNIIASNAILKQDLFSFELIRDGDDYPLILITNHTIDEDTKCFTGDFASAQKFIVNLLCEGGVPFSVDPFICVT